MVSDTRRIKSKRSRELQYEEEYARSIEATDVERTWERVKHAALDIGKEVWGSVRVKRNNPKSEGLRLK